MDPINAFSLAAGVLQVLDLSFKALSKCKEMYKDGSLAQHRDAKTFTDYLAETTKRLETSIQSATKPMSEEAKDVIKVSKECSSTATALLGELQELQLKPGSSLLQILKKSTRALRRKTIIAETEKKLEKYQNILNTRILSKLDAQAIQQIEKSRTIDQSVRDLAIALRQGRNTVTQLFADQTVVIQEHIDRRFDDQAYKGAMQRAQQQFKDSLFYPEIFARQDDIPKSHEGTCHWIFDSPQAVASNETMGGDLTENAKLQPWSNFTEWLENDQGTYWLSGKPGSGKSTLMKYITSEFRDFYRSGAASHRWGSGADLVTCSFFFWALGSPIQKNYVGFLRSLLYQIAEQREDLIPMIMGQEAISGASSHIHEHFRIHAWTKERLDDALRRFLSAKPSSINVCFFVDGLDEFAGDEDLLMQTIRLLSRTPRTHVCVSSRPEQIFRQGFAKSPQLRLQDLNYEDIKKATKYRLNSTLQEKFPQVPWMIVELVADIVDKAQGIFLWAELVTEDLKKGARNSDSIEELHKRVDRTPNTIEGLYEHMLERLDKPYFQDAARYFQIITANQDLLALEQGFLTSRFPVLTLLNCACADEKAWNHVLSHDLEYFQSPGFQDLCCNLETRILTRCAGLVEVAEHRQGFLVGVSRKKKNGGSTQLVRSNKGAQSLAHYLREVKFIHKTVMDFLQSHEEFFQNLDWRLTATLTITRGAMGVMSLTPIIMCEEDAPLGPFTIDKEFIMNLLSRPSWIEALWPAQTNYRAISDSTIQIVGQAYEILNHVNRSLNGLDHTLSNHFHKWKDYNFSFHDCLGFAAYFGRHDYVSRYTARTNRIKEDAEYVLSCTFSGLASSVGEPFDVRKTSVVVGGFFRIVIDYLAQSRESQLCMESKWVIFLNCTHRHITTLVRSRSQFGKNPQFLQQVAQSIILWKDTVAYFLHHNADSNTIFKGWLNVFCSDKGETGSRIHVKLRAAETVLAWVMRTFGFVNPAFREEIEEIEDLLKSHGGQHRRIILSLHIDSVPYRLTREQSDRLLHAWSFEDGSLPGTDLGGPWSVKAEEEEQEPVNPDPTTERKLKILLENIDRFKIKREKQTRIRGINGGTTLDFGSP